MNNQQSHGTAMTKNPVRPAYLVSGAAVALVLNVIAFWVADQAGATWEVGQPYALEVYAVIGATLFMFALGGVVTWLVSRTNPGFVKLAAWGGLALGLVSMVALVNAGDWATGLALGFMHVVTAGAWALSLLWNQEG